MFIEEQLYFDMSVKFDKFLKTKPENIEILSSAVIFSTDVNWRRWSSFKYRFTNFRIM